MKGRGRGDIIFSPAADKKMDTKLPENNTTRDNIGAISSLALAHIGDAVYELLVRTYLCDHGKLTSGGLHRASVKYVSAPAQAKAAEKIAQLFSDEESAVFRRGRNARVNSVPQNADIAEYHAATALEALFGWLYLVGRLERVNELFKAILEEN